MTLESSLLPPTNCCDAVPLANAWILFLTDQDGKIRDLAVYEIRPWEDESSKEHNAKTINYVGYYMTGRPYKDFGCCLNNWNEWNLADIFFKLGIQYGFNDIKTAIKCLIRLAAIKELRHSITEYLSYLDVDSEALMQHLEPCQADA